MTVKSYLMVLRKTPGRSYGKNLDNLSVRLPSDLVASLKLKVGDAVVISQRGLGITLVPITAGQLSAFVMAGLKKEEA